MYYINLEYYSKFQLQLWLTYFKIEVGIYCKYCVVYTNEYTGK